MKPDDSLLTFTCDRILACVSCLRSMTCSRRSKRTALVFVALIHLGLSAIVAHSAETSVCVRVKIEIDQELTLERQGFEARMNLNNGGAGELTNLSVVINFADENNVPVLATTDPNNTAAKFFIKLTSSATLPDTLAANAVGKFRWLIVPALAAGGMDPAGALYFVGAKLSYTLNGLVTNIDVLPDSIRVKPMPQLSLDYFLPYDVYGDDPFTPQIEPPVPFSLGVRVKNSGYGEAHRLKIESSQPRIIDNEQELAVKFAIKGSEVNGQAATPSLRTDFGTLAPNRSGVGRWLMTSSVSGRFTGFAATFTHSDDLGGAVTSLITDVKTHRLIHDVLVDLPGRDSVRDFLALDADATRVFESDNNDSIVADVSTSAVMSGFRDDFSITVPPTTALSYVKVADPKFGHRLLLSVVRSDGRPVNVNNAWLSASYLPDRGEWGYYVNIFDTGNAGGISYRLIYGDTVGGNHAPTLQIPYDRVTRNGTLTNFFVWASDPDYDPVALTASGLPQGATFTDLGLGVGRFTWTPGANQTGGFPVQFTASDGQLTEQKAMVIHVITGSLAKGWREHFWPGVTDPSIIGNGVDADRDGMKNLIEYGLGLDPTKSSLDGLPIPGMAEIGGSVFSTLTFVARTDDPALLFEVIASNNVFLPEIQWQVVSGTIPADQSDVASGFQRVIVRDSVPIDGTTPRRFLRLRVSTTEPE